MDTITQIALGAAVGEAALGKEAGNKAAYWGAGFGIVPDLDILSSPFVNEVQELAIHRGFSHSLVFCLLAAPIFGWLLSRYGSKEKVSWKRWSWMIFLVLTTHIFIDLCTSYGTQILQPFSDTPFSLNTVFIIDPFYTIPLLIGVIVSLTKNKTGTYRRWANTLGLIISTLYLLAGFGIKAHVNAVVEQNYEAAGIQPDQYMTTPAPLSNFLWTSYAVEGDTIYAGLYSIWDQNRKIEFHTISRNEELIEPYKEDAPVDRIIWFSRGYYLAEKQAEDIWMYDIRFGRSDLWIFNEPANYIRTYELEFNKDSSRVTGFQEEFAGFDEQANLFENLVNRTFGREQLIDL